MEEQRFHTVTYILNGYNKAKAIISMNTFQYPIHFFLQL